MIFSFFRRVRRTVCFFIVIAALMIFLKYEYPEVGKKIGGWISGFENTRISQAFSSMLTSMHDGNSLFDSVEVFYDNLQTEAPN